MTKKDLNEFSDIWTDDTIASQVDSNLREYQLKTGRKLEFPIYPDEIADILWGIKTEYPDRVLDVSGNDVLARFDPVRKIIQISTFMRANDGQVSFTTAHEVGHASMHGFISTVYCNDQGIDERSIKQIERQADKYASLLLMPSDLVHTIMVALVGRGSPVDMEVVSPKLMPILKISRQALEIRLGNLGYQLLNSKYGVSYERTHEKLFLELEEERQSRMV